MQTKCYLVVNNRGRVQVRATKPLLDWNEVAVEVNLDIPDSYFKHPQLTATITLPENQAKQVDITGETQENIKLAIQQHLGAELKISIQQTEGDEE